jgi:misacylated tRNA(Ala) deacylase
MGITRHGHTERLDLADPTLREWECTVVGVDPDRGIVLDRSAFYPGGGGQPPDHGVLLWSGVQTRIVGVRRGDDLALLPEPDDPLPPVGTVVRGAVEDERRTLVTGSNMEPLEGRLDFDLESVPEGFRDAVEAACAVEVAAGRAIAAYTLPREEALAIPDVIRTASNLLPPELEVVRIVDIDGLDVQADGGTHVASTSQIGRMRVVKVENKGKGFRRIRVALD